MEKKILCVLAAFDNESEARISALQQALYAKGFSGTQTKDTMPHITLCTESTAQETELIRLMKQAAKQQCIYVHFSHIGLFSEGKVLFLAPDTDRQLLQLKEYFGCSDSWSPHTTLLIDDPAVILQALPTVTEAFTPFTAQVRSLQLYEFWPTRHIFSVELEKE